jgi:hypothetical protein
MLSERFRARDLRIAPSQAGISMYQPEGGLMKSTTMRCELRWFFRMATPCPRQRSLILAIWCVAAAANAQSTQREQMNGARAMSSSAAPMALPDSPTPASLMGLSDTPAPSTVKNVGTVPDSVVRRE